MFLTKHQPLYLPPTSLAPNPTSYLNLAGAPQAGGGASLPGLPRTSSGGAKMFDRGARVGGARLSVGTLGAGNGGSFVSMLPPAGPTQEDEDLAVMRAVVEECSEVRWCCVSTVLHCGLLLFVAFILVWLLMPR